MSKSISSGDTAVFRQKLAQYKQLIDDDIAAYTKTMQARTLQQYGANARLEIDAFLEILNRGGKRIRGALVMLGYEMSGGDDQKMIIQAARAIEMLHAYLLIIDDIQDRSLTRRGGQAAQISLADYHRQHQLANDAEHFGVSLALNAALSGQHAAQVILADLDVPRDARLKVISIIHRTLGVTLHGQTNDIMNEMVAEVDEADVERVLEWKTARYTILNPLQVGMVLAGADTPATEAITDYAIHTGKAFQITDDILGTFGNEVESGKSPSDDMREGKRTLLTVYALKHAEAADKNFLVSTLGNKNLTPAEFARCKDILIESGALEYARKEAEAHITAALNGLQSQKYRWSPRGMEFLSGLATYLLARTS